MFDLISPELVRDIHIIPELPKLFTYSTSSSNLLLAKFSAFSGIMKPFNTEPFANSSFINLASVSSK